MEQDEIFRMAREAGVTKPADQDAWNIFQFSYESLERFAALVAAAERERIATKFMEIHNTQQHRNNYFAFAARVIREEV